MITLLHVILGEQAPKMLGIARAETVLMVLAGWAALVYRIRAEERVLAGDPGWAAYAARVRYRLLPGIW